MECPERTADNFLPSHRKKKFSLFLGTMLLLTGLITVNVGNAAVAQASTEVTVNPSQACQTIEGWGSTLA